ncbi:MAG: hypothetical protein V4596_12025 [Bdellovibrionota bacterium]
MYEPILFVHSWFRWIVYLSIIYFFFRSTYGWLKKKPWKHSDTNFIWAFDQIFNYQILFGFILWLAGSPLTKAVFADPGAALQNNVISFFTIRHGLTMIFALGLFHIGKARARKSPEEKRFKIYSIVFGLVFVIVSSAIPWPGLIYGRDLFKWFL